VIRIKAVLFRSAVCALDDEQAFAAEIESEARLLDRPIGRNIDRRVGERENSLNTRPRLPEPVRLAINRPAIERQRMSRDPPFELADALPDTPDSMLKIEIAHAGLPLFPGDGGDGGIPAGRAM
jgi:hypothetical protein